ncbi:fatty acid synthase-like [Polyergus mexicanus]|uniref:fatty acid synthase-like n=1 Tax=Polyergus mexicanus TaxID=615972 RepID=UPI0038B42365
MPPRIGKINNIEKFDAEFFNISVEEVHVIDPGYRILFEHTYEAIIDAGVNPAELQGTNTSVITAITICDSHQPLIYEKPYIAGLPILGCHKGMIANRISYWLGVTGPSYNIDCACSSSHFAMTEAYRMIRSGICEAAIVATVNLCLHPFVTHQFFHTGILSKDGYCKPYDEEGCGYMRSDAAVVMYLQKAKDARRIYATFVYGKTNCDSLKKKGITFPSLDKQKMLLEEFYEECDISPLELSYIEAHATGTLVGDSVELQAIDEALCAKRQLPLLLGSVKSNIGHPEAASGHCQIAKVLIAMETGIMAPTIHFKCPRKDMTAIIEGRINIITEPTEYKGSYIGINSFGFGGVNCHILLKSNSTIKINNGGDDNLPRLVAISGCTEEAVKIILDDGSVLGPACWNLMFDDLLKLLEGSNILFAAYADDLVVIVNDNSRKDIEVEGQRAVSLITDWCKFAMLQVSERKTEAIVLKSNAIVRNPIGRRGEDRPDRKRKNNRRIVDFVNRPPTIKINNAKIRFRETVRYLGVHLDRCMKVKSHCQKLSSKTGLLFGKLASWESLCVVAGMTPVDVLLKEYVARYNARKGLTAEIGNTIIPAEIEKKESFERIREEAINMWQTKWSSSMKGRTTFAFFKDIRQRLATRSLETNHWSTQALTGHGDFRERLGVSSIRKALRDLVPQSEWRWPEAAHFFVSSSEVYAAFADFCCESLWLKGFKSQS